MGMATYIVEGTQKHAIDAIDGQKNWENWGKWAQNWAEFVRQK